MAVSRAECLAPTKVDTSDREEERQRRQKEREGEGGEGMVGRYIARKSGPPRWVSNQRTSARYTTTQSAQCVERTCYSYMRVHIPEGNRMRELEEQDRRRLIFISRQGLWMLRKMYSGKWDIRKQLLWINSIWKTLYWKRAEMKIECQVNTLEKWRENCTLWAKSD